MDRFAPGPPVILPWHVIPASHGVIFHAPIYLDVAIEAVAAHCHHVIPPVFLEVDREEGGQLVPTRHLRGIVLAQRKKRSIILIGRRFVFVVVVFEWPLGRGNGSRSIRASIKEQEEAYHATGN